ncbi:MAG: ribosome recycling factor [Anaerolineaceae bacterium]|nr:ribosome recycling factor [Anaerolineaceae bacterium]
MLNEVLKETKDKMQSTLSVFEEDLHGIRGNRASTALVDRLSVEYYGQPTEMRQLANISTPEPMTIMIRPYDKTAVKAIEHAIQEANIGINPNVDGDVIRLNMPPLTRERRQEMVKLLGKRTEDARIAIRNIRRSANDDIKMLEDEKEIGEDQAHRGRDQVQELTDQFIEKIEDAAKVKETDITEV